MPAETEEITLTLGGLYCAACVARVERALTAAPGVEQALVNLATRQAKVRYNPQATNLETLSAVVREAGYEVEGASREQRPPRSPAAEVREFRNRFLLALILSLPVWAAMIPPVEHAIPVGHGAMNFILLAFSTPVMFYSGASFFSGAYRAARAADHIVRQSRNRIGTQCLGESQLHRVDGQTLRAPQSRRHRVRGNG